MVRGSSTENRAKGPGRAARAGLAALLGLLIGLWGPPAARAGDPPFNRSTNWGGTGLMEIPNARVLDDGEIRAGVAQALPYRWYTGGMGVLPGLEFTGRFTQMTNIPTGMKGYGSYKDKAFDLKYQILPESRRFPALAVGLNDFHGTRLFPSEYVAISRQIYPFDFTLGLGSGRLEGIEVPWLDRLPLVDDVGLFAGVAVDLGYRTQFMAEYNPIDYEEDRRAAGRAVPEGAEWPVNLGVRFEVLPGIDLGVSYQRGDTLGMSVNLQALLGKPMLGKGPDPPQRVSVDRRPFSERGMKEMVIEISEAVSGAGFSNVSVMTDGSVLRAGFENNKYLSERKAVGRVLRILLYHSPEDTSMLEVIARKRDLPVLKVSVEPEHFRKYITGEMPERIFRKLVRVETAGGEEELEWAAEEGGIDYEVNVKPDLETFLNDPSGVFKYRVGLKPFGTLSPWKGAVLHGRVDIPFYSDISSSNIPPPDAVRSDSWYYSGTERTLERLLVDQAVPIGARSYGRVSAGLWERMYGGVGGEFLTFLGDGRFAVGVESDWVRKRTPGTSLEFEDFSAHTLLGSVFYRHPDPDITLRARVGRFLGEDEGVLLEASRRFPTGAVVGGWYSFTDTDHMKGFFNRGYNDKGVFLSLPVRMFTRGETASYYSYALSPWTRDVAALPAHWQELYGITGDLTERMFKENLSEIKE